MTTYRLYPSTNGPSSSAGDTSDYTMGLAFEVTSSGMQLNGYYWWVADGAQSTGAQKFALWEATGEHTGSVVSGSEVTSGTLSLGWNYVALGSPVSLSQNQEYMAVTAVPGHTGRERLLGDQRLLHRRAARARTASRAARCWPTRPPAATRTWSPPTAAPR